MNSRASRATCSRYCNAKMRSWELIAKTIDEIVEPAVLTRTPVPVKTNRQALTEVFAGLLRAFPTSTSRSRI